jgi:hypothetical protein
MTTFNWSIDWMQVKPQEGDLANVVVTVSWRCTGERVVDDQSYSASVFNNVSFDAPGEPFTPYEDLTLEQVLGWCWDNGVDQEATEAAVDAYIDGQVSPPVVTKPLPWVTPEPTPDE